MNTQEETQPTAENATSEAAFNQNQPFNAATEPLDDDDEPKAQNFFEGLEVSDDEDDLEFDAKTELPDYDFAQNPVIKLRDGTEAVFKIPDLNSEQRADDLRQTTSITSPHKINGQNPTQDFTDFVKADVRYFLDNVLELRNFKFNHDDAPANFDARAEVRKEMVGSREVSITYAHLVPIKHKRAFVGRLYGGKMEVEKPAEKADEVVALNAVRVVTIKQELGVEPMSNGRTTPPTHRIRYFFREPNAKESTAWTQCWNGYKLPIKGGGTKSTSSFKTDKVVALFDKLIDRIEGASLNGEKLEVKNSNHLAGVPAGVKRNMLAMAMGEFTGDVGND